MSHVHTPLQRLSFRISVLATRTGLSRNRRNRRRWHLLRAVNRWRRDPRSHAA